MSKICFIAHRGYSGRYLMNTEEAFIKAVEHGSGGIETDVRMTKDGVLVVNHDDDAVFEDGTRLFIKDATYAELTAKPLRNPYTSTKLYVCTFERYLEICRDGNGIAGGIDRDDVHRQSGSFLSDPAGIAVVPLRDLDVPAA